MASVHRISLTEAYKALCEATVVVYGRYAARNSGSGDFDARRSDGSGLRDRLARFAQTVEVETDRVADELFHFLPRAADHADAGEIRAIRAPRLAFVFDHD